MTLAQAQTELNLVNTAISNLITGGLQEYSIAGRRSASKISLKDLRDQRRQLEFLIARLSGGMFTVAQFRDPE